MKFLHIVPPSIRMMDTYIKMVVENFPQEDHFFYFIRQCPKSENALFKYGNVFQMQGDTRYQKIKDFYRTLEQADTIIWHGFMHPTRFSLFLYVFRKFLKKSVWLMWGIDLYNWKRSGKGIKSRVCNYIERRCREKMKAVIAPLEPDADVFKSYFPKSNAECFVVPYPISMESFSAMESFSHWTQRSNRIPYVQIAHNAHSFNNHLEIIESLSHFAEENFKVFLPLSYGNDWHNGTDGYISKVKSAATDTFGGDRVSTLYRLMPQKEYTRFLWNMDICIFRAARQNALGNILKSLYMGNKVFLSPQSPLYGFFKSKDIQVYNSEEIEQMSYEEFIKMPPRSNAVKWIRENYHLRYAVKRWNQLFAHLAAEPSQELNEQTLAEKYPLANETGQDTFSAIRKDNWLGLTRYTTLNTKNLARSKDIKNLIIAGTGRCALSALQCVYSANRVQTIYFVKGFLGDKEINLQHKTGNVDVIESLSGWMPDPDSERFICAIDDGAERQAAVEYLNSNGAVFASIQGHNVSIGYGAVVGDGTVLFPNVSVSINCTIGAHNYIHACVIEDNVTVGDYCTIEAGSVIGHGAIIGSRVVLGSGCTICPFAVVEDDQIVLPGEVVSTGLRNKAEARSS